MKPWRKTYLQIVSFFVLLFLLVSFLPAPWAMTTDEERKLGKRILLEMEGKVGMVRDLTLQTFTERIGYNLVDQLGPTPFDYKFYVINGTDANAFAIPGGYIFVTTGLIVLAENEHELAGVLSHEIAHVTQRHIAVMYERSKRLSIASMVAMLAAMLAGGGGTASQAGAAMAMATAEALALKYTREMETDADQNSLQTLVKAGYDPRGMVTFLNKINRMSMAYAPKIPTYLSTHPALEDRIALLENLLSSNPVPLGPFRAVSRFKKVQAKAFVEEREADGAVRNFRAQVEANPQDWESYYGLGLAYRKMGRLDKALEALQQAHLLAPSDTDVLRERGIVYFFAGKLDQAIDDLERVRTIEETGSNGRGDLLTLYSLGRAYQEKGEFARALSFYKQVQKGAPGYTEVYLNLGSVCGRLGEKGLSHFYFGRHFRMRGDRKNALLHFRTAMEYLERGSPERGEAQQEIRDLVEAGKS